MVKEEIILQLTQACDINIVKGKFFDIKVTDNAVIIPKLCLCVGFRNKTMITLVERNWSIRRRKQAGMEMSFLDILALAC